MGFQLEACYDCFTLREPTSRTTRIMWVARRSAHTLFPVERIGVRASHVAIPFARSSPCLVKSGEFLLKGAWNDGCKASYSDHTVHGSMLAVALLLSLASGAWALPDSNSLRRTVPTRTPNREQPVY